jgi:hypothetical protein
LKALQRPSKGGKKNGIQKEGMPSAAELLRAQEYIKCDRVREVQCEIMFLEFKMNATESQ